MHNFFFRAVASDGQLRSGTIHAETERWVAQELRRQGLTPVYVGSQPQKGFELKLPAFKGAKRKDVLFFTQELSTLLNAPACRWIARLPSPASLPSAPASGCWSWIFCAW
jgi:type II secretory pathway component PulF